MARSDYITPEGFQRLQDELQHLWRVERPKVTEAVATAAALGDRSENADYIYGKKRLREIDSRLHFLQKRADELVVVRSAPDREDRVFFGAWVTVEDEDGEERRYRIVGPDEFDPERAFISTNSPLARALMGREEGDEVSYQRPRGEARLTVVAIRYDDPDAEAGA
jgi:transcription elongation factor GreB